MCRGNYKSEKDLFLNTLLWFTFILVIAAPKEFSSLESSYWQRINNPLNILKRVSDQNMSTSFQL